MTVTRSKDGELTEKLKGLYGRLTGRTLLAFFGVAFGLWTFLTIAGEMAEGETRAFDQRLLLALRTAGEPSNPIGPRWFEESMRDITALGGFTVLTLLTLTAVIALLRSGRKLDAATMATAVIGAELSSDLLKVAYARPRPLLVPHESYVYSNSFPSGHSAVSAATYLMLAIFDRECGEAKTIQGDDLLCRHPDRHRRRREPRLSRGALANGCPGWLGARRGLGDPGLDLRRFSQSIAVAVSPMISKRIRR